MFTATYKRFVLIYYYIIILLYQVCSIQLYFNMPPRSTPSSVTKNRIKSGYHTALAGFADWYFNIFPNGDNVADNDTRLKSSGISHHGKTTRG